MSEQVLVPQEIQNILDGKLATPLITGNKRIIEEMKKQAGDSNA